MDRRRRRCVAHHYYDIDKKVVEATLGNVLVTPVVLRTSVDSVLSRPLAVVLDFHTEAGFDFSDFFPLLNPSGIFGM